MANRTSNHSQLDLIHRFIGTDRRIFILFCIMVIFLIPDTMINYVSDFIYPQLIMLWGIVFFVIIACIFAFVFYLILEFVKKTSREIRTKDQYIKVFHRIVTGAQYALISIMVFVVLEVLLTMQYHTIALTAATSINWLLTMVILGLFAQRFISWFKSNRNSIVVLLYGLSFAGTAFSLAIISANNIAILVEKQPTITPQYEVVFPSDYFEAGSFLSILFDMYQYIDMISFALLISATAFLLSHYSRKLGTWKFWAIIFLPMFYYLTASLENFGLYSPSDSELFYYYLFASLNSTSGGILFGFVFLTVARTIRQDSPVRQYMIIAAYGFVLYFISNQVTLSATSYPPFGLATQSLLVISSYMIFLGVYSTAISISQDNLLRRSIKKIAAKDTNLLSSIGTAYMEQEIQRTVNSMKNVVEEQEKELEEQTGIEANLEEDEMKKYLEEVMQEVGKGKNPSA